MFLFLTVLQAIVAAGLVGVVLMQRSEGGGLGIGGNPNAALGARGAADFLTRATKWLAVLFVILSIALAAVAVNKTSSSTISTTLDREIGATTTDDLLGEPTTDPLAPAPATQSDPAPAADDPLAE